MCQSISRVIEVESHGTYVFLDDNLFRLKSTHVEAISLPSSIKEILDRVADAKYEEKKVASDIILEMNWITDELDRKITQN